MNIPTREKCLELLDRNKTPSNVIDHIKTVCLVSEKIMQRLKRKKIPVNEKLVIAASLLHDIERIKKNHVIEGANLVRKLGFSQVAQVMEKHSLYQLDKKVVQPKTIEEKIVFYADKRALHDRIVSIEERFSDLKKRYDLPHLDKEYAFTKKIENELLGEDIEL